MIIGIDISQIVYGTGVSRYTRELVRNLLILDFDNQYKLFAGVLRQKNIVTEFLNSLPRNRHNFSIFYKLFPPRMAGLVWNKWHIKPIEKFIGRCDIFHSSDWAQPPALCKQVTTVHDLTPMLYPQYHTPAVVNNFTMRLGRVQHDCHGIIAVSQATKQDLIKRAFIPAKKISVIYEGVSSTLTQSTAADFEAKTLAKYNIVKPFFLTVGTREPRKNMKTIIQAFGTAGLVDRSHLVIAGKEGWGDWAGGEGSTDQTAVIQTGYVSDQELSVLYKKALAFIYMSEYEGFGLPVLEAMSTGCPVICSNVSSLPEVAGKAAILLPPKDQEMLRKALLYMLQHQDERVIWQKKGLLQASQFSWEKMAKETLRFYRAILNSY